MGMNQMKSDHTPSMMEYLMSLTPDQMKEAVNALPRCEQLALVYDFCCNVDGMAQTVIASTDKTWENR